MKLTGSEDVVMESPVLEAFRGYAAELLARHDRQERLVRINRDITTESKRIIFYLHSLDSQSKSSCLDSAEKRITVLTEGLLKKAAAELQVGSSTTVPVPRVMAPALEELSEALCLLKYLRTPQNFSDIPSWESLQEIISVKQEGGNEVTPCLSVNPLGFMLGLMDFTGELMRQCINGASQPDNEKCFIICKLLQQTYTNFLRISYNKEVHKKMSTLKHSVQKAEETCYKLKLRNLQL